MLAIALAAATLATASAFAPLRIVLPALSIRSSSPSFVCSMSSADKADKNEELMLRLSLDQMNNEIRRQGSMGQSSKDLDDAISAFKLPDSEQQTLDAFKAFDKDGNGQISAGKIALATCFSNDSILKHHQIVVHYSILLLCVYNRHISSRNRRISSWCAVQGRCSPMTPAAHVYQHS